MTTAAMAASAPVSALSVRPPPGTEGAGFFAGGAASALGAAFDPFAPPAPTPPAGTPALPTAPLPAAPELSAWALQEAPGDAADDAFAPRHTILEAWAVSPLTAQGWNHEQALAGLSAAPVTTIPPAFTESGSPRTAGIIGSLGPTASAAEVAAFLEATGFGAYAAAFLANDVDGKVMAVLDDAELERLGVTSLGHRKKILFARDAAAPGAVATPSTTLTDGTLPLVEPVHVAPAMVPARGPALAAEPALPSFSPFPMSSGTPPVGASSTFSPFPMSPGTPQVGGSTSFNPFPAAGASGASARRTDGTRSMPGDERATRSTLPGVDNAAPAGFTQDASDDPRASLTTSDDNDDGSTGADGWTIETLDAFMRRRAGKFRLDLADPATQLSLEIDYLAKYVPGGVRAQAWAKVSPLADRWLELAPKSAEAIDCQARARVGLRPASLPQVLQAVKQATSAQPKSAHLQFLYADLLWSTSDRKAFEVALRAYAALVPAEDRRLAELVNRKVSARGDVEVSPVWAAAVTIGVLVFTLGAAMSLGRTERYDTPLNTMWLVRHALLLAGAFFVLKKTSVSFATTLRSVVAPGPMNLLPVAVVGGVIVQLTLAQIYGVGRARADFFLPLALVTAFVDVVTLRLFFQVAVQQHFEIAGDRRGGVVAAVFAQWLYAGTYVENWGGATTFFVWTGLATLCIALPAALLFARSRSIIAPVLWQFSLYALQVVGLK
jgi:hypothetical protein